MVRRNAVKRRFSGSVSTLDTGPPQYSSPHSREAAVFRFSQYPRHRAAAIFFTALTGGGSFPVQSAASIPGCRNILHRTHGRRQFSGLVSTLDTGPPQKLHRTHGRRQFSGLVGSFDTGPPQYSSPHSREAAVFRFSQYPRYRAAAINVLVQPECATKKEQADENRPAKQGCGIKI